MYEYFMQFWRNTKKYKLVAYSLMLQFLYEMLMHLLS